MVTRDTNIVYLRGDISNTWASAQNKPFTFTGLYGGVDYSNTYTWTVSGISIQIYNDTTIENLQISCAQNFTTSLSAPPTAASTARSIYGNFNNLKIGRGLSRNGTYKNFIAVVASSATSATGSASNITKYSLIVESGFYDNICIANTTGTASMYINAKVLYGSDYDRVKNDDTKLIVNSVASGSYGGIIRGESTTDVTISTVVKSGQFGTGKFDHTTGIYVGSRGTTGANNFAIRDIKVEGGYIYNLIGGPLVDPSLEGRNSIYIHMTGGTVDLLTAGAGTTQTYGNRIVSLTGGIVNYSVLGGSNGISGTGTTDAQLSGSSLIYLGGNSQVGNPTYVSTNATLSTTNTVEAGSVFGIGNGRSGVTGAGSNDNSNIIIDGNAHVLRNVYGGGNYGAVGTISSANTNTTNIKILDGTIDGDVYGGANQNGAGTSTKIATINIEMTGGRVLGSIYGGSNLYGAVYGSTNINIIAGEVGNNVYGGGKGGGTGAIGATTGGTFVTQNVRVNIGDEDSVPIIGGNVYGGSAFGVVNGTARNSTLTEYTTTVTVNNGNIGSVFGGAEGNATYTPWVAGNITVTINDGDIGYVYGCMDQAGTPNGSVIVYLNGGTIIDSYGGGNRSSANAVYIYLQGAETERLFGGSNNSGTITTSNVSVTSGTAGIVYGGNNAGGNTVTANVTINGGSVTDVYGGGREADTGTSHVVLLDADTLINSVYGGGREANVTTTNVTSTGVDVTSIFGGSNMNGTVTTSNVRINSGEIGDVYGGNNAGGNTVTSNVRIDDGTIGDVFGGGREAPNGNATVIINNGNITNLYGGGDLAIAANTIVTVNNGNISKVFGGGNEANVSQTNVEINNGTIGNLYGGGNAAGVTNNTNLTAKAGTIIVNVYGGGEEGIVYGNTYVDVSNIQIGGSLYAGGNGVTAVVHGNANLNMHGDTVVGTVNSVSPVSGCVFGGGNAAATGTESINNSTSTVNIAGGDIYGNVYGGANTSVVYGYALVKIGYEEVGNNNLIKSDIYIKGTIFGGGESNAEGSEIYDFDAISVTRGIDIYIDGSGHNSFVTEGSIFGSGNASNTSGESHIYISNFGTADNPQRNISIQRANLVVLDSSAMVLSGATDRTNEYSDTYFAISRVDELKVKNDSILYLNYGGNLLKKLSSVVDVGAFEVKGAATINEATGETIKNVDNRIYLRENRQLNIATNEQITAYGEVSGMFFLGLYTSAFSPVGSTGPYHHSYDNGDVITNEGTFSYNSRVLGLHKTNHDITVDGFYTNYNEEGNIKVGYVGVTPPDDLFYIWEVGENMDVTVFNIELTASKYATLGTTELALRGLDFDVMNARFVLTGFSAGLADGVSLIDKTGIPIIANTDDDADSIFGLGMRAGNIGWQSGDSTQFYTANGGTYSGTTTYYHENTNYTPTLSFYLYHSQNLSVERDIGESKVRFQVIVPIDDLNYMITYVDINITMRTAMYPDDYYEAAIAPGEEYELFTSTQTDITKESKFSSYYALYIEDFSNSIYNSSIDYFNCKHVLVSRDSVGTPYSFPAGTKLTMMDVVQKKFFYYIVTQADESSGKYVYNISDFVSMGSPDGSNNEPFDEVASMQLYYNQEHDIIYENYIFHVDFKEANIQIDLIENTLLMELQDANDYTILSVLGIQREPMKYSVYANQSAGINISGSVNPSLVYLGKTGSLVLDTNYTPSIVDSKMVFDTLAFDYKMGVKMSIFDSNDNQLSGDDLLGVRFLLDDIAYYPSMDGTLRLNVSEKLSNVRSRISIDTTNNASIPTGTYRIRVEAFGSPDGICYGWNEPDYADIIFTIVNGKYGLKVLTNDVSKIVDKETGENIDEENSLIANLSYFSLLSDPHITVSLQRRDYDTVYSMEYSLVDLQDYVTNNLVPAWNEDGSEYMYEYTYSDNPQEASVLTLIMEENLMTGTYKLVFKLYNEDTYIGEAYEYLIIK